MRNKRKYTSFLLLLVLILNTFLSNGKIAMAADMEGEGTKASPYLIRTVEDLYSISQNPAAHYKLMNDLDLMNITREPIINFIGVFDGGGHVIKGLRLKGNECTGLFGSVSGAVIKNVTLYTPVINTNKNKVGALCGYVLNSRLSNCYSIDGKVTGAQYTGGLAGYVVKSELYQCYSSNRITASSNTGGLIGYSNRTLISQCVANGSVTGTEFMAGLVGGVGDELIANDCYTICNIQSNVGTTPNAVTGLINGHSSDSEIINCYSVGQIKNKTKNGLITDNVVNVKNSYFDKSILGLDTPVDQARTTEQMFQKSNYKGWDFEDIWCIDEGENYPSLRFEKEINKPEPVQHQLKVVLGPEEQLQLSIDNDLAENDKMIWISSNPETAIVDVTGLIKAVKKGNAIITVESADKSYKEEIKVMVVEDAKKYRLAIDLKVGDKARLIIDDAADKIGIWTVIDSSVVKITNEGRVTAAAAGLAIVTALDENGAEVGQVYIRVR